MAVSDSISKSLRDSKTLRWTVLFIVSFTMMMGYFMTDVMSPLENMLETSKEMGGFGWSSSEYGFFSGSYGFINVFLLMLFFGGLILDRCGVRFTGLLSCGLMVVGAGIKWYALSQVSPDATTYVDLPLLGLSDANVKNQVLLAALGFSIFGMGSEITGITVTKVIAKWFTGYELALAMGLQVATARLGTALALGASAPVAQAINLPAPVLFGLVMLLIGLFVYIVYCVMDRKLDASEIANGQTLSDEAQEEPFRLRDLMVIFRNPGFWMITLLCLLFYGGVFPFLKFATKLMIYKYGVSEGLAGTIPALLPFGTIFLTPLFGGVYDKKGRGATLMILGSLLLTLVHILFTLPVLEYVWFGVALMILLGIAFSLVPSAMWPSVPKIIPMKQLGSAYAIIFYIQNIGLSLIPILIGNVIDRYSKMELPDGTLDYDFTIPMAIFASFGVLAVLIGLVLKAINKKMRYGLEDANIKS